MHSGSGNVRANVSSEKYSHAWNTGEDVRPRTPEDETTSPVVLLVILKSRKFGFTILVLYDAVVQYFLQYSSVACREVAAV